MDSASRISELPAEHPPSERSTKDLSAASAPRRDIHVGPLLVRGYSQQEIDLLREQAVSESDRVAQDHPEVIALVEARARRILDLRERHLFAGLAAIGLSASAARAVRPWLADPVACFHWFRATVEGDETFYLGDNWGLAVDVVLFLHRAEGQEVQRGAGLPADLVEEYVLRQALARLGTLDAQAVETVVGSVFDRSGTVARGAFERVLRAFVRERERLGLVPPGTNLDDRSAFDGERAALAAAFAGSGRTTSGRGVPVSWAKALLVSLFLGAVIAVTVFTSAEAFAGLSRVDPKLWAALGACLATIVVGVAVENRLALFLAMLLGMPLEWPIWPLGDDARVCRRKADWFARFLGEKPRGYNTRGAHLAYGAIAVKRTLKRLCLRRERIDESMTALTLRRSRAMAEFADLHTRLAQAVANGSLDATPLGRRDAALRREVEEIDQRLRRARLLIQSEVVGTFLRAWERLRESGPISRETHAQASAQFRQPHGESPGLLASGLVRGPLAFVFDYGMFLGRVGIAILFIGTLQASHWGWALVLFALQLYVIEPVILKIHVASLGLVLDAPGHKLIDVRSYLDETRLGEGVFLVPITVPKFSTSPAIANLKAIVATAGRRCGVVLARVTPFSMSAGRRDTVVEVGGAEFNRAAAARRLRDALVSELASSRSTFPVDAEVQAHDGQVRITLKGSDDAIWTLIGEDAGQAFVYLWRSLRALRDTLTHLGPAFRPVFILASNTKDDDVIDYEIANVQELQRYSDTEYRGQVGFLYLLHGGEWLDFNAYRRAFGPSDAALVKALPSLERRLADPSLPARDYLLRRLASPLHPIDVARVFNRILSDRSFYAAFDGFDFASLPAHLCPPRETLERLARRRGGESLGRRESREMNRDLLLTVLPLRVTGDFFKKVGNDIPVQELLVAGKTRPTTYVDRRTSEHVQDPAVPNYRRVWGDFARYTGLRGTNAEIQARILAGEDVEVGFVPRLGAVIDDKNDFAAGEIEKAMATMLHPANAHVVIGVPHINVTLPQFAGRTVSSDYILASKSARELHNSTDGRVRARIFDASSPAYGKWWKRPQPYLEHYKQEVLNPAHALSHDFQQSYLVAGAAGRLSGFAEALSGPSRFRVRTFTPQRATRKFGRTLVFALLIGAAALLLPIALAFGPLR